MKILSSIFIAFIILVSVISLGFAQPASNLAQSDNQFAFDLYSHLASNKGNIFFSPYSLSCAIEMVYEGARGQTSQEMSTVLHLNDNNADRRSEITAFMQQINSPDKTYELSVANALWAQKAYPFKDDYLSLIKNTYLAEARNLDFVADPEGSRVTINGWVSDNTKNRINDLLPPGDIKSSTSLILTNAVYFKDKWAVPFKKENTKLDTFWLTPDQSVQTDMMRLLGESFNYFDNDQVQIVQLPYKFNEFSIFIILPRTKDIQGLEKNITLRMLKQLQTAMVSQTVNVFLPKFKFDSAYEMSDILTGMGMKLAFDKKNADFSGMTVLQSNEYLYIDQILHKAWIDVSEEGTEAAAATLVRMGEQGVSYGPPPPEPKEFRADHPFIFLIQDYKTGHILFMGRVSDPRK